MWLFFILHSTSCVRILSYILFLSLFLSLSLSVLTRGRHSGLRLFRSVVAVSLSSSLLFSTSPSLSLSLNCDE